MSIGLVDGRVPVITEEDLRRFRTEHYPSAHEPKDFFVASCSDYSKREDIGNQDGASGDDGHDYAYAKEEVEEEYDDGLGYYADGVKRTLTDDQIAMFRHTQIEMLLRERRRRRALEKEQQEEEEEGEVKEGEVEVEGRGGGGGEKTAQIDQDIAEHDEVQGSNQNSASAGATTSPETHSLTGDNSYAIVTQTESVPATKPSTSQRKRPRTRYHDDKHGEGNVWNFRRRARELDEKEETKVDLDY